MTIETRIDPALFSPLGRAPLRRGNRLVNAMSVDVEDFFQVQAFAGVVKRDDWSGFQTRVVQNTERVLDVFARANTKATFFSLGWVAERYPALIRRIVAEGHELGSHGWAHHLVGDQTPEAFRDDIRRTKQTLEDISGQVVNGYRAATFSIGRRTLWALDILADEGYLYSSSIFPVNHDLYGMPEAPKGPFLPRPGSSFEEYPMSTIDVMGRTLPCSGGGYFRLSPYALFRWAVKRLNEQDQRACIFYFHPWEVDPDQPRVAGLSAKAKFRHYLNLNRMEARLTRLLADFPWDRVDTVMLQGAAAPAPRAVTGIAS